MEFKRSPLLKSRVISEFINFQGRKLFDISKNSIKISKNNENLSNQQNINELPALEFSRYFLVGPNPQ